MKKRIERVRRELAVLEADTLMVLSDENRFYLSGFSGHDGGYNESAGALLITNDRLVLATDGRYTLQAGAEAPLYEVVTYTAGLSRILPDLLSGLGTRCLAVEAGRMPHADFVRISSALEEKGMNIQIRDAGPALDRLRASKEPGEIDAIRRALAFAEDAFELFVNYDLAPGMTEKQAAWVLERRMREMGADGLSFPIIAAFGENSALPHAECGDRAAQPGLPLLFDWGARVGGYCSDSTRSFVLGKADTSYRRAHQA
ncbi:MAG: M24 family metallopeptidase, partial [Thermodesulfobacteriota bacterium]